MSRSFHSSPLFPMPVELRPGDGVLGIPMPSDDTAAQARARAQPRLDELVGTRPVRGTRFRL